MTRRHITREMIEAAIANGWTQTKAARVYGFNRTSLYHAALRFCLEWPHRQTPKAEQSVPMSGLKFSVSPKAVQRYLCQGRRA